MYIKVVLFRLLPCIIGHFCLQLLTQSELNEAFAMSMLEGIVKSVLLHIRNRYIHILVNIISDKVLAPYKSDKLVAARKSDNAF